MCSIYSLDFFFHILCRISGRVFSVDRLSWSGVVQPSSWHWIYSRGMVWFPQRLSDQQNEAWMRLSDVTTSLHLKRYLINSGTNFSEKLPSSSVFLFLFAFLFLFCFVLVFLCFCLFLFVFLCLCLCLCLCLFLFVLLFVLLFVFLFVLLFVFLFVFLFCVFVFVFVFLFMFSFCYCFCFCFCVCVCVCVFLLVLLFCFCFLTSMMLLLSCLPTNCRATGSWKIRFHCLGRTQNFLPQFPSEFRWTSYMFLLPVLLQILNTIARHYYLNHVWPAVIWFSQQLYAIPWFLTMFCRKYLRPALWCFR